MAVSEARRSPLCCLLMLAWCTAAISAADPGQKLRILGVFGHSGKSHFDVFKPLLRELARRGHNLTVISYFPRTEADVAAEPLPNYKDISLFSEGSSVLVNVIDLRSVDHSYRRLFRTVFRMNRLAAQACETGLSNPLAKHFVASQEEFDLVITESFNTYCFFALFHWLDAPFIEMSTHQLMPWVYEKLAISHEASYKPAMFARVSRPMGFLDRMWNVFTVWLFTKAADTLYRWRDQSTAEKIFGPGIPDLTERSRNAALMLVNTHFSLHGPQPYPPNVVEVGGMHIPEKNNPLPEDIQKFLDEAREGVLYFNLGSMVKTATMPEDKLTVMLNVLASFPRKVILKWETDELPMKLDNVLVKKWLPQFDILNHPNVKCYFGHGGLLGLSEGVYSGVPMVLMPFYGDQHLNAMAAKARGVAEIVEFTELNEQNLRHALDEVFNNTKYRENARRLSKAFRDRPATPLQTAVWWTEYIGRGNGLPYVKSEASSLPWYVRNLVDVMAAFAAMGLVTLYAIYWVSKRLLCGRKKTKADANHYANSKKKN
ncbi:UDP-glycosyltransferase UGT5-like isoform X2 [Halictus rubicundus]|uniref:UDP-glycosyltransferase UGT5-like isoform X2 n=1 Tax=Halictus rubicundus TaxID=77578 RepID=UPI0040372CA1